MDRRELFKGAVAVPLAAAFAWPGLGQAARRTLKRIRPSDPAWPSAAPGARLNEMVTQGNWPWWFTDSGSVPVSKCVNALNGTAVPEDDVT